MFVCISCILYSKYLCHVKEEGSISSRVFSIMICFTGTLILISNTEVDPVLIDASLLLMFLSSEFYVNDLLCSCCEQPLLNKPPPPRLLWDPNEKKPSEKQSHNLKERRSLRIPKGGCKNSRTQITSPGIPVKQ